MRTMWNELGVSILKNCPKLRKVDENPCKVKHNSEYKKKKSVMMMMVILMKLRMMMVQEPNEEKEVNTTQIHKFS